MAKYVVAAMVGCLYVAVAAWFVKGEGQAYRESLRPAQVAAPEPIKVETAPAPPAPTPAPAAAKPSTVLAANTPAPAPAHKTKTRPRAKTAVSKKSEDVLAPPYKPSAATIAWANALDLGKLSAEDEQRLGLELNMEINSQQLPDETPSEDNYLGRVKEVAKPFLEARARKDINYTFTILDSDAVNAFSTAGGYIYICRGLFDLVGADEDSALEFVLAHEIAHVDLKHPLAVIAGMNAEMKKTKKDYDTLQQCFFPIVLAYPDKNEDEADAWAWKQMRKLGRSRLEALAFIRRFEGYAKDHKFPDGRRPPEENSNVLDNHFRAHPSPTERKKRADAIFISQAPAAAPAPSK
jgi:beta-barrel assembly-enhancing protease